MAIIGTESADTITGTLGDDVIEGLGGNDLINASQGNDIIDGGLGRDRVFAGMGNIALFAAPTGSRVYTITATYLGDSSGTLDTDLIGVERVTLSTVGAGDFGDTIDASGWTSFVFNGVSIFAGAGNDFITGSALSDIIRPNFGINMVDAGGGFDSVVMAFDNSNPAATLYLTNAGGAVVTTQNGIVTNQIFNAEEFIVIGTITGASARIDASSYVGAAGSTLILYDHDGTDVIIGSAGSEIFANTYVNITGNDIFTGNGGADIFDYTFAILGMDRDTITDLDGDDIIDFQYNDLVDNGGGALADQFIGSAAFTGVAGQYRFQIVGNQTLVEADVNGDGVADQTLTILNGGFILAETAPGTQQLHIVNQVITGTAGVDTLTGTRNDDLIFGLDGRDIINASQGHDVVDGGALNDRIVVTIANAALFDAPTGSRTYVFTASHLGDSSGSLDTDLISVERVSFSTVGAGDYGDTIDLSGWISPSGGSMTVTLGAGNDTVIGSASGDRIRAGLGTNVVDAAGGYDIVNVAVANANPGTVYVTSLGSTLFTTQNGVQTNSVANAEEIWVFGTAIGVDARIDASGYTGSPGQTLLLVDHDGSDIFIGSHGSEIFGNIHGNVTGSDIFTGNGGADIFDYTFAVSGMNGDRITDFDADDVIDMQFNNAVENGGGLRADRFLGFGNFTGVAGEYRYQIVGNQTLVQADTDGNGIADQTLTLDGIYYLAETTAGSNLLRMVQPIVGTNLANSLSGTTGWDVLSGLGGNDIFFATAGRDLVQGGAGSDRVIVNMGDAARFAAGTGARTYTLANGLIQDSTGDLYTGLNSVERLIVSTLGTGNFADTIDLTGWTSGRRVTLTLGAGDDHVQGGASNDTIEVDAGDGNNSIDAGAGTDEARLIFLNTAGATYVLTGSGGTIVASNGGASVTTVTNAEVIAIWGSDFDAAVTRVDASGVTGFAGTLVFYDHNGSNISIGSAGRDIFANVSGGEAGTDVYTGNGGADIYDYTYAVGSMDRDTITDFDGDDIIDFLYNDIAVNAGGLRADHFIGTAAFSGTAGEYRTQIVGATTIVQADTDGDGIADETLTIANGAFQLGETSAGSNQLQLIQQNLAGTVADGYVAGATLFIDGNGNRLLDAGEANTVTGPGGAFTLTTFQVGTMVAIGGINVDTGLANTMTLVAPAGSGVVNPLTTLIAAIVAASNGTTSAAAAEAALSAALGLDPALDLLNLDLLAQGTDPAALAAQKVAAMIANLVATAESTQGATAGAEAALIGALAALVAGGGPVSLTSAATLTALLTVALPGVANVAAVAAAAAADAQAIAAATTIAGIGAAQLAALLTGDALDNDLSGNDAGNLLSGLGGNDRLYGLGGDDTLDGGTGDDRMEGGLGNDLYLVDTVGDQAIELAGQGYDTVRSSTSLTLSANLERLELTGTAISGTGNALDNVILGNAASNRLSGGAGADRLQGGDGVDFLTGGSGDDRFIAEINAFKSAAKDGPIALDLITDFTRGDKIDLSGIDANSLVAGHQAFSFKGTDANKTAGGLSFKVYDSVTAAEKALGMEIDGVVGKSPYLGPVTMVFGNVDGGTQDFTLALFNTNGVTAADFLF